jgi:GNAT superfamily N-acetyltransferase
MTPDRPAVPDHIPVDRLTVVPANQASWEDLQAILGKTDSGKCQCQGYKLGWTELRTTPLAERAERFREQTGCGEPEAKTTSGLVAYLDGVPVGWCAVEPRIEYPRLRKTAWAGREEDKSDPGVWVVTCFVTRKGYRRRGVTSALARASVGFARERGARALEAYTMITHPGVEITWGELHVGSRNVFADAGFEVVHQPSKRRVVMRVDFAAPAPATADADEDAGSSDGDETA